MGAVLFTMLTGYIPYPMGSVSAMLQVHARMPEPIASKTGAVVLPAVDELIEHAMAKNPADRYSNAQAMLEVLERA